MLHFGSIDRWFEFYGSLLGVFISGLFILLVFDLEQRNQKKKENRRLLELKVVFLLALLKIDQSLKNAIERLQQIIDELTTKKIGDLIINSPSLNTNSINWISKNDLFKIYIIEDQIKKDNVTLFWRLMDGLEGIENFQREFDKLFNAYTENIKQYSGMWQSSMGELSRIRDRIQLKYEHDFKTSKEPFIYDFLKKFDEVAMKWIKIDNHKSYEIANEHFLTPLKNVCLYVNPDPFVLETVDRINDAMTAYKNIAKSRKIFSELFNSKIQRLNRISASIKDFTDFHSGIRSSIRGKSNSR